MMGSRECLSLYSYMSQPSLLRLALILKYLSEGAEDIAIIVVPICMFSDINFSRYY